MTAKSNGTTASYYGGPLAIVKRPLAVSAVALATLCAGNAQDASSAWKTNTQSAQFVPFRDFVGSIRTASASDVLVRPNVKVQDATAAQEMRAHLLKLYDGVNVSHSFVIGSQTVDCIPTAEQPAVRMMGLKQIASAPTNAPGMPKTNNGASIASQQLPEGQADRFGNKVGCEAGTIPMLRTTLDAMSHFKSLREFMQKGPDGANYVPLPGKIVPPATYGHKYSFAYQYVNNLGDNANINLWRPYVYTDINEIFSLAQSWTIGLGSTTQTAESGWQNYPALYGTENSVPFIYWTADGYSSTGCYNLTCGAFVQVNHSIAFGVPFTAGSYSVANGGQTELPFQWYLYAGNWWLGYNGTWIGYYPGSIYRGGQMAYYSNLLEFGTESVGLTIWPQEGSGMWAGYGWTHSLYERELWYRGLNGATYWDSLTPDQPSPACYSTAGPYYASNWGIYSYFGGPGGAGCQ